MMASNRFCHVSIPEMVRLIDGETFLWLVADVCFNSRDGAIDSHELRANQRIIARFNSRDGAIDSKCSWQDRNW